MTILAGFRCEDGIVICADTQETVEPAKRAVPKLRYEESKDGGQDLAIAFCGAGHGPFTDKLINNCWEDVQLSTSLDDVCEEVEKSIKDTYKEFGRIYQVGERPTVEIIYGIKMHGASKMFHAYGPIVNEKPQYQACGQGEYLSDFLAMRMYKHGLDLGQLLVLAAYVLFQTKEHVEGCGGESHIAVLRNEGTSGMVSASRVSEITELLQSVDGQIGSIILDSANLEYSRKDFHRQAISSLKIIDIFREHAIESVKRLNEFSAPAGTTLAGIFPIETDDLGIPKR